MRILGLDASTSTIGIAVIEYDIDGYFPHLIHSEYYKPEKADGILDMLLKARTYILNIARRFNIDEFVIEDYVRFMKNSSSAATTIPLAILNITLRLTILDNLHIQPSSLNVLKIRHALKKKNILPKKEEIPELVAEYLRIPYPWLYKINKRTKEQQIMEESYDVADAMAVALAWIKLKSRPVRKAASRKK